MNLLQPGDHLDHYRIEDLVACTTAAFTFRGTDLRSSRAVAIKVLRDEVASNPSVCKRFEREAKIGRRLDHPNVVKLVSSEHRGGPYMVTEWLEGRPLRAILLEQVRLSAERSLHLSLGVCEALYYIHSRGIVHLDLKPENVILNSADQITLIDFGLAASGGSQRLTIGKSWDTMGTPDYISPEGVRGIRGDARSDLYALGIMLYEMVTGTVPFEGSNPLAIMHSRLVDDPVPPRSIAPDISPRLQSVILRALERDPRRRYVSAHEFARDLAHQEPPIAEERAPVRPNQRRWLRPLKLRNQSGWRSSQS